VRFANTSKIIARKKRYNRLMFDLSHLL